MTDEESLRRLLLERSVQRGRFVLASGRTSSYYIDCRPATMSAEGMVLIGRMAWEAIRAAGWKPTSVGGLTMGADPVSYAIAGASFGTDMPVDAFSVRKEPKDHGTGRAIEGNFKPGDQVVIVEDVVTSGTSAQKATEAVEEAGGKVVGIIAVVDREEGGAAALKAAGHTVVALTNVSALGLKNTNE
jgi:orotate phosphoribosyltransferase